MRRRLAAFMVMRALGLKALKLGLQRGVVTYGPAFLNPLLKGGNAGVGGCQSGASFQPAKPLSQINMPHLI